MRLIWSEKPGIGWLEHIFAVEKEYTFLRQSVVGNATFELDKAGATPSKRV